MVHGRFAYIVARGPRTNGSIPGSPPTVSSASRSAAVYSGFTPMPSGVSHVNVPGSAPFSSLAARSRQRSSSASLMCVSEPRKTRPRRVEAARTKSAGPEARRFRWGGFVARRAGGFGGRFGVYRRSCRILYRRQNVQVEECRAEMTTVTIAGPEHDSAGRTPPGCDWGQAGAVIDKVNDADVEPDTCHV